MGALFVETHPWAKVAVVGRKESCGSNPCTLNLPAGKYTLRLVNPLDGQHQDFPVQVTADQTTTFEKQLVWP